MFTGLIGEIGEVVAVQGEEAASRLTVRAACARELSQGDSVAVDGVCLTAEEMSADRFVVVAVAETLSRSTLGSLRPGDRVNLELALRLGDRVGGHIVQGHVDGHGEIEQVTAEGPSRRVRIAAAPEVLRYAVEKGSIAVGGVSLTIAELDSRTFAVALIPETLDQTTLGDVSAGQTVNLEVDVMAKYVERLSAPLLRAGA